FDRVYLISGTNTEGLGFPDLQHIYEKVALQLDLDISSVAARDLQTVAVNHPTDFNNRPQGRMSCYGSFGAAQLGGTPELIRYELLPKLVEEAMRSLMASSSTNAPISSLTANPEF